MERFFLVRVGALGNVGRFYAGHDGTRYPRGCRVVVRTARGLELGEVLSDADEVPLHQADGKILRRMTTADELLEARLQMHREKAYTACAARIAELNLPVVLMDVEQLFDGRNLVFYFLGDPCPELDQITGELAELYDSQVQFRRFAETLAQGCGPGCGTEQAEGSGCGSNCGSGCGLASACGSRGGH